MPEVQGVPVFSTLSVAECEAVLQRGQVGRIAFVYRERIDIEPVHYVYADHHLYGRTQRGTKVAVLAHHPWVAFEVDEVRALFDWQSVVLRGRITFPDAARSAKEGEEVQRGVALLRTLMPTAFTADDPTPDRTMIFVMHVHEMSGRSARPVT